MLVFNINSKKRLFTVAVKAIERNVVNGMTVFSDFLVFLQIVNENHFRYR